MRRPAEEHHGFLAAHRPVDGGDNLWGFSLALFIGVLAGTYSSIYIANVVLIWLNLNSEDLIPPAATGKEVDDRP